MRDIILVGNNIIMLLS